ncbi:hypothetical protein ES705_39796 [subsurface metagenome]
MIRRVFSRQTYNGYHLVNYSGEDEDPSPIGFFKKDGGKDEYGFTANADDSPKCPSPGRSMGRPWDNFLYVPSLCQKCIWLYHTSSNEYDCLFLTREKINPRALVRGGS